MGWLGELTSCQNLTIIIPIKTKDKQMHTIQLQIQDDIYDELKSKGIDINNKLQEFLLNLADDGYPSISTQEAKQRVSDAVDRYRNGTGKYTPYDKNFTDEMESYIQSL
jgi:hypothetical protein